MLKEKSQEKELEWKRIPLELKDVGKGNKELYAKTGGGDSTIRLVPVKTGIDVIENSRAIHIERGFRSQHKREIELGFLTTTTHCDFDGKIRSVNFVFLRDENDKTPLKASVDFEKERNSKFSKLPDAMKQLLKEYGILGEYGGSVEMGWKSNTLLSDADKRIDYFEEPAGNFSGLAHSQTLSFELRMFSEPQLVVTETVVAGGKDDSYGNIMSASLVKSYAAKEGFIGTHIDIMFQNSVGQPEKVFTFLGEYVYADEGEKIRQIINNPKAAEFKEIVERNRELMKIKPDGIQSSGSS